MLRPEPERLAFLEGVCIRSAVHFSKMAARTIKKLLSQTNFCWDKSNKFSCGATRLDVTKNITPTLRILSYADIVNGVSSPALLLGSCVIPVRFALRSPFSSVFPCCNLTACSSLLCKYQSLLLSLKGLSVLFNFLYSNTAACGCQHEIVKKHNVFYIYIWKLDKKHKFSRGLHLRSS